MSFGKKSLSVLYLDNGRFPELGLAKKENACSGWSD